MEYIFVRKRHGTGCEGDYVHKLRSGKNDQEAMEAMLVEYERTKDDEDEGTAFLAGAG